jgi:retron-type reverse transcriptase
LLAAWHAIRKNAETSQRAGTKRKAKEFGEDLPNNLRSIQTRLRDGYKFAKAYGATPPKGAGKPGKRPLVVAPIEDRITQRAILDVLQDAKEIVGVQRVLQTPTSIGGIRGRGVGHAIALFDERVTAGDRYVAGSDIAGFFQKIPREAVIDFLRNEGVETEFITLVNDALRVELANEDRLSEEDRRLFPTGKDGVAQGCPLSALAGNIVLAGFDEAMNDRGITCIRYIDDFIVLGKSHDAVEKAMTAAKGILAGLGMDIYDPQTDPNKAFVGIIGEPHVFLGYELLPGSYPPSPNAREKLLRQVRDLITEGQRSIVKAVKDRPLTNRDRAYAQTLVAIDYTLRGWRGSFQSSNCPDVFKRLDAEVDRCLKDFLAFYLAKVAGQPSVKSRRALGVGVLNG